MRCVIGVFESSSEEIPPKPENLTVLSDWNVKFGFHIPKILTLYLLFGMQLRIKIRNIAIA